MYPQLSNRLLYLKHQEDDVSTLFILEAPFDKEINKDRPCVGCTGISMSKALFGSKIEIPLGDILNGIEECIPNNAENYAVFDTFKFPIDPIVADKLGVSLSDLWSRENSQWDKIKELDGNTGCALKKQKEETGFYDRAYHYKTLIQYIQNVDSKVLKKFINDYKVELNQAISTFKNLKYIVVCGFIAQSILCFAYKLPFCIMPYRKDCIVSNKRKILRFVEHPINAHKRNNNPLWCYTAKNDSLFTLNTNIKC